MDLTQVAARHRDRQEKAMHRERQARAQLRVS